MNPLRSPMSHGATIPTPRVVEARATIADILSGRDNRLLAIVGPCSVHDPVATREYLEALAQQAERLRDDLYIVARVYTEKPRTRHGWNGMLLQPHLNEGFQLDEGVAAARAVMTWAQHAGLPVATEFVEPLLAGYLQDLVSWGAIGARTVESPPHRRLASGLPMPVGIKNRVDGAVAPAVDAVAVATEPQPVLSWDEVSGPHWSESNGNPHAHVVLRGGDSGPNYTATHVEDALRELTAVSVDPRVLVDCSHGNSGKDHNRQPLVAEAVAAQIRNGQRGLAGVLVESFLRPGSQPLEPPLRYGVSVTDGCLGLPATVSLLEQLAHSARARRRCLRQGAVEQR